MSCRYLVTRHFVLFEFIYNNEKITFSIIRLKCAIYFSSVLLRRIVHIYKWVLEALPSVLNT